MIENPGFKKENTGRIHVLVSGKVQGVFFRVNTAKKAKEEKLVGWVRNTDDGRVEIVAEGERGSLGRFIQFLNKGPTAAEVKEVLIEEKEPKGEKGFKVVN